MSKTVVPPPAVRRPLAAPGRWARPEQAAGPVALGVALLVVVGGFVHDGAQFALVLANGLTAAALYFLVASGFTLIFGLMRVTNLAHGAIYLLGGYVGYAVYDATGSWPLAVLAGALAAAALGVVMQRLLLPIYGQELREALITLGLAIILGDVLLAQFGGEAVDIGVPAGFDGSVTLPGDVVVPSYRLLVIGLALVVGAGLWLLLRRTRFGMTVRAGVDDRVMVAATGTNIRVLFAVVFALGAGLAGASGVIGGSFLSLQPGEDSRYLLYSLVVVIVGGLGSIPGAALGALLVGLIDNVAAFYLPTWSSLVTFGLLVVVLAVRPQGLLGRETARKGEGALPVTPGIALPRRAVPVVAAVVVVVAAAMPFLVTQFVLSQILTKSLWLGLAALSLVFLAGTVGMVSLAQTATYGVAGYTVADITVVLGLDPWLGALLGVLAAVLFATVVGAVAARSRGVYLLMLTLAVGVFAYDFALQARPVTRGFGGINDVAAPTLGGVDLAAPVWLYWTSLAVAVAVYAGLVHLRRTPLGLALQGVRDAEPRMRSLGHDVFALRVTAFAISGLIAGLAGVLAVWFNGQISPGAVDLQRTIDLLVVAVIGGLYRFEGAFVGALAVTLLANFAGDVTGRVNTLIGACFVLALVASPGGIVGALGRASTGLRRRPVVSTAAAPPAA